MNPFLQLLSGSGLLVMVAIASAAAVAPADVNIENLAVSASLTGQPGDVAAGREVFINRSEGNCLACHANSETSEELFHGGVGPSLDGVANRWQPGQLRAIVINAKWVFSEHTIMPGFYTLDVGVNVSKELEGKTILTAQQIEDVVAYLGTLD